MQKGIVKATIVFEMAGRPPEHLEKTLKEFIDLFSKEPGVKVLSKNFHKPKKIENVGEQKDIRLQGELYSSFAEIDIQTDSMIDLLRISFKFMPSHVEVTYPEGFNLDNIDFNSLINEILARLHHYDAVVKSALMNNQVLASQISELSKQSQNSSLPVVVTETEKPVKKKRASKKKKK